MESTLQWKNFFSKWKKAFHFIILIEPIWWPPNTSWPPISVPSFSHHNNCFLLLLLFIFFFNLWKFAAIYVQVAKFLSGDVLSQCSGAASRKLPNSQYTFPSFSSSFHVQPVWLSAWTMRKDKPCRRWRRFERNPKFLRKC